MMDLLAFGIGVTELFILVIVIPAVASLAVILFVVMKNKSGRR